MTRNCRLAAVRSFVQYLLQHDVTRAGQYSAILAIRTKRTTRRAVTYLEPEEARALIAAIDARSCTGERDRALLLFLYNTGARVSEALSLRPSALRLDRPRQVRLLGKGSKERICPLWPETATALRRVIRGGSSEEPLFKKWRGVPDPEACKGRGSAMSGTTETPHHTSCSTAQLRVRPSSGGD
jgi:integrase/recombinase XerD